MWDTEWVATSSFQTLFVQFHLYFDTDFYFFFLPFVPHTWELYLGSIPDIHGAASDVASMLIVSRDVDRFFFFFIL